MQIATDNLIHGTAVISNRSESYAILGLDNLQVLQVCYVKAYAHPRLRGVGEVRLQQTCLSDGSIRFCGYELFSGAFDDRVGSFVAGIKGSVDPRTQAVKADMIIETGSGSSQMYRLGGHGSYVIAGNGVCAFELTLH